MKYPKTFENYKDTYWEGEMNGDIKRIDIKDVEKHLDDTNSEIIDLDIKDIKDLSILNKRKNFDEKTKERIDKADISYPIIITKLNGVYNRIIDGNHRLQNAINNKKKTIKARILDLNNSPDIFYELFK